MARLILEQNKSVIKDYSFVKGNLTIGRHKGNDIVLDNPQVSSHHARVDRIGAQYILTDLQSTNGTIANGTNIVSHKLSHGDRILIGDSVLLFIGTEMAKVIEEEKKLDLNKTIIVGEPKRKKGIAELKVVRPKFVAEGVKPRPLLGTPTLVLMAVLILTVGGWYFGNQEALLTQWISEAKAPTQMREKESAIVVRVPLSPQPEEVQAVQGTRTARVAPPPLAAEESTHPTLPERTPSDTAVGDDNESNSSQDIDQPEVSTLAASPSIERGEPRLEGIVWSNDSRHSRAVVNGVALRAGESAGKITVVEIAKGYVLVQNGQSDSTTRLTLGK